MKRFLTATLVVACVITALATPEDDLFFGHGIYPLNEQGDHVRLWTAEGWDPKEDQIWCNLRGDTISFNAKCGAKNAIARRGRWYTGRRVQDFQGTVSFRSRTQEAGNGPGFHCMLYGWVFSVDNSWTQSNRRDEFYVVLRESEFSPAGDPFVDARIIDNHLYRLYRGTHNNGTWGNGNGYRFVAVADTPHQDPIDMRKFFEWYQFWDMRGFDWVDAISVGFEIHPGGDHAIRMRITDLELPQ